MKLRRIFSNLLIFSLMIFQASSVFAHTTSQDGLVTLTFSTEPPIAEEPTLISINLTDENKNSVTALDTVHERKIHVILIGQDLKTVIHTHPENFSEGFANQSQGIYTVQYAFPKAGFYAALLSYSSNNQDS